MCVYTTIRYGVDNRNYWIRHLPDLTSMQLLNHAIKTCPMVLYIYFFIISILSGLGREDPFQVSCSRQLSSDQSTITVECTGNRAIASQVCTLNGKDIADCKSV